MSESANHLERMPAVGDAQEAQAWGSGVFFDGTVLVESWFDMGPCVWDPCDKEDDWEG